MRIPTRTVRMAAPAHAGANSAHSPMAETLDKTPGQCASRTWSEGRGLALPGEPQQGFP